MAVEAMAERARQAILALRDRAICPGGLAHMSIRERAALVDRGAPVKEDTVVRAEMVAGRSVSRESA